MTFFLLLLPPCTPKKGEKKRVSWKELQFHNYAFTDKVTFPVVIRTRYAIQRLYLHTFYGDLAFFPYNYS